jgi:hypothetical protein
MPVGAEHVAVGHVSATYANGGGVAVDDAGARTADTDDGIPVVGVTLPPLQAARVSHAAAAKVNDVFNSSFPFETRSNASKRLLWIVQSAALPRWLAV